MSQKRYCPKCMNRVARKAWRCPLCGKALLAWWHYALLLVAGLGVTVVLMNSRACRSGGEYGPNHPVYR